MINFLSSWVKNLSLALIIVSILEMILPNNKTKKYIKMIMGIYILFSIIAPFIENSDKLDISNLENFDFSFTEENDVSSVNDMAVNQSSMDNRLNQIYKERLQNDIIQKMSQNGYEVDTCKVIAHLSNDDSGIEKITLKIKSKIDESGSNTTKNSIEDKVVTEIQKIQKVDVKISENSKNSEDNKNSDKEDSQSADEQNKNITKTDIKIIKDFLIKEYGVSEQCLKIS